MMKKKQVFRMLLLLIIMTLWGNTTELKREGWNLISVCQDIKALLHLPCLSKPLKTKLS